VNSQIRGRLWILGCLLKKSANQNIGAPEANGRTANRSDAVDPKGERRVLDRLYNHSLGSQGIITGYRRLAMHLGGENEEEREREVRRY